MKQDIFSVITERRSVRTFSSKRVTRDDLHLLIEYGCAAPSAGNLQDYRFISSLDQEKINLLPDACMEQDWISHASGVIVVVSQPKIIEEYFPEQGARMATQAASAAIQNILLGAHAHGLGACWVSGLSQAAVREIFEIPDSAFVEGVIAVGHPYGKPDIKTSESYENLVYYETFGNDKKNKDLLNRDYSLIIEKRINSMKKNSKSYEEQIRKVQQKVKEFFFKQ